MVTGLGRLDDPDHYLTLARSLAEGRGFALDGRPTAYRPPLYPILLAPLVGDAGPIGAALGRGRRCTWPWASGTVVAGPSDGPAAGGSRRAGALVGGGDRGVRPGPGGPVAVGDDRDARRVPGRRDPGGARPSRARGADPGRARLRPGEPLPARASCPAAGLAALAGAGRRAGRRGGPGSAGPSLLLAATVATLAPWAWRNARALGEPVWTTTHGGYTLALANNPAYYADVLDGPPGAVWSGPNQARLVRRGRPVDGRDDRARGRPAAPRDRRCGCSASGPATFLRASVARLGRFWGLAPVGRGLSGAGSGWRRPPGPSRSGSRWRSGWPGRPILAMAGGRGAVVVIALTVVHLAYWTDLRMRAPIVPAIALIAAGARSPTVRRGRSDGARRIQSTARSGTHRCAMSRLGKKPEKIRFSYYANSEDWLVLRQPLSAGSP